MDDKPIPPADVIIESRATQMHQNNDDNATLTIWKKKKKREENRLITYNRN